MKTTREYNNAYRQKARKDLLENCPKWQELTLCMDKFISLILSKLKLLSTTESDIKYQIVLIASFIRSHHVILDLIESSDLIDAATLIRKQLELLARFNEIKSKDLKQLFGKTPNIGKINMGPTYGSLSEIAHSSKFEPLSLLGVATNSESIGYSVYPKFNEHTITTISIYCDIFCKFSAEMLQYESFTEKDDFSELAMNILNHFISVGVDSNIPYFEDWKEHD